MLCRGCCCGCLPLHPFGCSLWMFVEWIEWNSHADWMSRVGFRTRFVFNKIAIRIHKAFHMLFSSIELNYSLRFITSVQFRMLFTQQPSWKVLTLIHNLQYIWFNLNFYIFHFSILINLFNRSMLFLDSWMGLLPLINHIFYRSCGSL